MLLRYARIGRWVTQITCSELLRRSIAVNHTPWKRASSFDFIRFLRFFSSMDTQIGPVKLVPPECVRGMTELNRELFKTKIHVPYFAVEVKNLKESLHALKPYLLKLSRFTAVEDVADCMTKNVLLNPEMINEKENVDALEKNLKEEMKWKEISIEYENWKEDEILKAVLPLDADGSTSYSRIGHIIQLNLRDHLNDYRFLIGHVLFDKIRGVTLVVNKKNIIESTFRNFEMEVLAGSGSTVTTVKENGVTYTFDFALVYWNPRLSTEHERIVKMMQSYDVLFDVFAGVGPFSVPAAKKKCKIFANDLNPESYKWLLSNIKQNKVESQVESFNLDGRDFIKTIVRDNLVNIWRDYKCGNLVVEPKIHVVMNLPALAVEFLDSFEGLCTGYSDEFEKDKIIYPKIHVYMFVRGTDIKEIAFKMTRDVLKVPDSCELEYFYVRHVAPMKDMVRISFFLSHEILFGRKYCEDSENELPAKRIRLE